MIEADEDAPVFHIDETTTEEGFDVSYFVYDSLADSVTFEDNAISLFTATKFEKYPKKDSTFFEDGSQWYGL